MVALYGAIWRHTWRQQLLLIVLSLAVAGLAALPLEFQKQLINGMTDGVGFDVLLTDGTELIAVIVLSLALKGILNYRTGIVAERTILAIRNRSVANEIERPTAGLDQKAKGTLATVVSSEAEVLGKFVGGAVAEPLLHIGTLLSVLGFVALTAPTLAMVVASIMLPQVLIVLWSQRRVDALMRLRVQRLRRAVARITAEALATVAGTLSDDFQLLFEKRCRIFVWKLSTKFVLSLLDGVGLVIVLVYGGWLVTTGETDVGSVVAATIALKRMQEPWRQVVAFYRNLSGARVQYELLRERLMPVAQAQGAPQPARP